MMGEAPSSPRRRRRGPQARLYGVFVRHGGSAPRDNAVEAVVRGDWPYRVSSDFEHVADLTLAARGFETTGFYKTNFPPGIPTSSDQYVLAVTPNVEIFVQNVVNDP